MNNKKNPLLSQKISFPILIVPSFYGEGFPRGIIEANTLSIPVIASKVSAEKIPSKKSIYISENNETNSYKKCVNKIIKEYFSDQIKERLENARENAINKFTEKEIVKQTIKVYDSFKFNKKQTYFFLKNKKNINNWLPK